MIGVIWRTSHTDDHEGLFEKFKTTAGIVATYQLRDENEVVVVTLWENAAKREAYMGSALQSEIAAANPGSSRLVYEVIDSVSRSSAAEDYERHPVMAMSEG
jgi:heme-degrading monooxygenase HmoA